MSTVHFSLLAAWSSTNMSNICQWPVSYHCNVTGKYESSCSDSKCVRESIEVHCAPPTSKWAGYSLRLVPWDPPFPQTLLHRGPNPLYGCQWQSSHQKPSRRLGLPGYVGWTRPDELRALLTSPCSGRRNLPNSADQLSQTLRLVLNTVQTSQTNRQLTALPPNLPVRRAFFKPLLNDNRKSTS